MLNFVCWGGSVLGMIISLKNNARPRKKPFEALKEEYKQTLHKHYGLQYKEVSRDELAKIKVKIQEKFRKEERVRYLKISLFVLIICGFIFFLFSYQMKRNSVINTQNKEVRKINAMTPAEQFEKYINDGYQLMKEENYNGAKYLFLSALNLDPDDYKANPGLTEVYIKNCISKETDCTDAENYLSGSLKRFGQTKELIVLEKLLYSKN
jgi:Tfp pilus assembly protein PilF